MEEASPAFVCGLGRWGRLGLGKDVSTKHHLFPMKSMIGQNIIKTASGAGHSYIIIQNDKNDIQNTSVFSWGKCNFGQLGHGEQEGDKDTPTQIKSLDNKGVIEVIGGDSYGYAICSDGSVYSWGSGFYGSLGHGNESHLFEPTLVNGLNDIKIVKGNAGMAHTILLSSGGDLYSCGRNDFGQLGTGTKVSKKVPFKITIDENNHKKIIDVACGSMHSICLDENGIVYAWGSNKYNEITPTTESYIDRHLKPQVVKIEKKCVSVGAGLHFCWAIDIDHELWMWGDNLGGQLAQPNIAKVTIPTIVLKKSGKPILVKKVDSTQYSTYCITTKGDVFGWGELTLWQDKIEGRTIPNSSLCVPKIESSVKDKNPIEISCGCNHVVVILKS